MGVWADVNPVNVTVLAPVVDARQINIVQVGLFQVFFTYFTYVPKVVLTDRQIGRHTYKPESYGSR